MQQRRFERGTVIAHPATRLKLCYPLSYVQIPVIIRMVLLAHIPKVRGPSLD